MVITQSKDWYFNLDKQTISINNKKQLQFTALAFISVKRTQPFCSNKICFDWLKAKKKINWKSAWYNYGDCYAPHGVYSISMHKHIFTLILLMVHTMNWIHCVFGGIYFWLQATCKRTHVQCGLADFSCCSGGMRSQWDTNKKKVISVRLHQTFRVVGKNAFHGDHMNSAHWCTHNSFELVFVSVLLI